MISALQRGGYVIVMRHASAPATLPTAATAAPGNTALERQLDASGRANAAAMGKAIRDLRIPIGTVLVSPTFRARQTAQLAGWTSAEPHAELGDNGQGMQSVLPEVQTAWLQQRIGEKPREGTNTVIITQSPNIAVAFPAASDVAEGEALVVRPGETPLTTVIVARVRIEEWPSLVGAR
jgi:phosphohistidine phosphatase SixA